METALDAITGSECDAGTVLDAESGWDMETALDPKTGCDAGTVLDAETGWETGTTRASKWLTSSWPV
jgi:hypothetical protein